MDVQQAVYTRTSIRDFLPEPVSDDVVRTLLEGASRAPSGGNLQPWRIYVVNGESLIRLREFLRDRPAFEPLEYDMYPPKLWEPYRTSRFENGEQLYGVLGIGRDDKAERARWFARNDDFFGAPCAIFCFVDRGMGQPQWSDLGMFLQTCMLLAQEKGLSTCAQEYWSVRHGSIQEFVGAPEQEMLFCGVSLGRANPDAAINTLRTTRRPLEEWARWV